MSFGAEVDLHAGEMMRQPPLLSGSPSSGLLHHPDQRSHDIATHRSRILRAADDGSSQCAYLPALTAVSLPLVRGSADEAGFFSQYIIHVLFSIEALGA